MVINKKREKKTGILGIKTNLIIYIVSLLFIGNIYLDVFNSEGKLYTKILSMGLPFMKNYDSNREEEDTSGINPLKILGMEVSLFNINNEAIQQDEHSTMAYKSFELDDKNIELIQEDKIPEGATVSKAFNSKLKKNLDLSKPEILIYHTHDAEQFMPKTKDCYEEEYSIIGVGNELEKELELYGISVVHDKTRHCTKSYDDSYLRSGETVDKYLNEYGNNFKLIIDLHRDGTSENPNFIVNMNDEKVAKIMFVNTKNSKFFNKNDELVNSMREISNKLFPGFSRGVKTYNRGKNAFNQDKSEKSLLIEVGSQYNSIEEAKASAKYIARIIAEQLNK